MRKVNEYDLEWMERASPGGGFRGSWKGISSNLGAKGGKEPAREATHSTWES